MGSVGVVGLAVDGTIAALNDDMRLTIGLGFWGEFFLLQVLVTAPVLGIVSYLRIRSGKPLPDKRRRYRTGLFIQALLLLITMLAARAQRVPIIAGPLPGFTAWFLAAAFLSVLALRTRRALPKLSPARLERVRIILPDDASQMPYWVAISAMAGITEECAYRGLAFRFLAAGLGSVPLALTLCIVSFGVAHMVQGWRGVLGTSIVAAIMHATVFLTGSLYLAIVTHAVYDLTVGIIAMPILNKFARANEPIPVVEA